MFEGDGSSTNSRRLRRLGTLPAANSRSARTKPANAPNALAIPDGGSKLSDKPRKLTYKEQRELEALPEKIEALETEQAELTPHGEPDFYRQASDKITATMERLEAVKSDLEACYERWQTLESIGS